MPGLVVKPGKDDRLCDSVARLQRNAHNLKQSVLREAGRTLTE